MGPLNILLHTKHISCRPNGYIEEDIFPIISLWELMTRGMANLDPRGMVGRIYAGDLCYILNL